MSQNEHINPPHLSPAVVVNVMWGSTEGKSIIGFLNKHQIHKEILAFLGIWNKLHLFATVWMLRISILLPFFWARNEKKMWISVVLTPDLLGVNVWDVDEGIFQRTSVIICLNLLPDSQPSCVSVQTNRCGWSFCLVQRLTVDGFTAETKWKCNQLLFHSSLNIVLLTVEHFNSAGVLPSSKAVKKKTKKNE